MIPLHIIAASRRVATSEWTPSDLPGLGVWFDATDSETLTVSDGKVTAWIDKSDNRFDMSQAGTRPTPAIGGSINGHHALTFAGAQMLQGAPNVYLPTAVTMFLVAETTTTSAGTGVAAIWPYKNSEWSSPYVRQGVLRNRSNARAFSNGQYITGNLPLGEPFVLSFTSYPAQVRVDEVTQNVDPGGATAFDGVTTALTIGANSVGAEGWHGPIGEIIVCDGTLTPADIGLAEQYLMTKWGI